MWLESAGLDYERLAPDLMRTVWSRIAACLREEYGVTTSEHPIAEPANRSSRRRIGWWVVSGG